LRNEAGSALNSRASMRFTSWNGLNIALPFCHGIRRRVRMLM
jgi:hypothetical protein